MKLIISNINKIYKNCQYINDCIAKLTSDDLQRYNNISNTNRKLQFLMGRMLIYENYGYNFYIHQNGKLITKETYISLSHSDFYVILAFSDKMVGVDIENIAKKRNFKQLGKFLGFKNCKTNLDFYRQFTAYEADYKSTIKTNIHHKYFKIDNYLICISLENQNEPIEIFHTVPYEKKDKIYLRSCEFN